MNELFTKALTEINSVKRKAHVAYVGLSIVRALATAMIVASLWFNVDPAKPLWGLTLGLLCFLLLISFTAYTKKHSVDANDFILGLDIAHQNSNMSPFIAAYKPTADIEQDWRSRLQRELRRIKALETRRLTAMSSSISIPALAALLLWSKAQPSFNSVLAEAKDVINLFEAEKNLEILTGAIEAKDAGKPLSLSGSPPSLKLMPQNILRFTYNSGQRVAHEQPPSLVLHTKEEGQNKLLNTFQMQPRFDQEGRAAGWTLDFSVDKTSSLSLTSKDDVVLANFEVEQLPIPEVHFKLTSTLQDPWPDNIPIPLMIDVKARNPLRKIQIAIKGKGKATRENVTSILGEHTTEVSTPYKLNLEPYMSDDVVEFELTAEATDAAAPEPLTGISSPLMIRVASAYGRYKATLDTLTQVRKSLEEAIHNQKATDEGGLLKQTSTALAQSETSPFFDALDRMNLTRFREVIASLPGRDTKQKLATMIQVNDELSDFLFEHEALDDRERDRDFFIASRTLSRVMERPKDQRSVQTTQLEKQLLSFLTQRSARWKMRVERLPEGVRPSGWAKVRDQKPFHAGVSESVNRDDVQDSVAAQSVLAKTTNAYKVWIDELEAKEDEFRQRKEKEQQQNLTNARNELRELQQRQDQVSTALDRASSRSQEDLSTKWQSARPQENSNIKQSKELLAQLRALSPDAGERLQAAVDAMEETVQNGNTSNFNLAESASDVAGRLLRDAEQSAAKKQQQQKGQGRGRRKRAAGDDYYGNAVVPGDIELKTEYQVDARYRQDILRDIQHSGETEEERSLLDGYLREVLR